MSIKTKKISLAECPHTEGLIVVIDVIRAFTTAAYAFGAGAEKIILTGEIEEAFDLHRSLPGSLIAGEQHGIPIPGFHYGNSPVEIANAPSIKGKTIVFRTSSGTQGVVKSKKASKILVSSFVIAQATYHRILQLTPQELSFVITGSKTGEEDVALADYLKSKLSNALTDPKPFLEKVKNSPSGQLLFNEEAPHFRKHDLEAVCQVDKFSFALEVFQENGLPTLRPIHF